LDFVLQSLCQEAAMYERCLNEAERILAADRDVVVAVKKVWEQVVKYGKQQGFEVPSLVDFEAMLEADPRFEFVPSIPTLPGQDGFPDDEENQEEMERLGFYSGDRVKLRRIDFMDAGIVGGMNRKADHTVVPLDEMWELRSEGDVEAEFGEKLPKSSLLKREVNEAFTEQRMKKKAESVQTRKTPKTRSGGRSLKPSAMSGKQSRRKSNSIPRRGRTK
jgi:hypothetical protein